MASILAGAGPGVPGVVEHGPRRSRQVALTFDACSGRPPGRLDEGVLRVLVEKRAKATVFVGGRWAEQDPTRLRRLLADPLLELGSHAYRHPHLPTLSAPALRRELERGVETLTRLAGRRPTLLRAPYVEVDARVLKAARALGLTVVGGDLPSGDPDPHFDRARLTRGVLRRVQGGTIVILHINGRGWHTAEALAGIIDGLRSRGFELVTVSELLNRG